MQISHQTTMIGEQIGSQSTNLEELKAYLTGRQGVIEQELLDQKMRLAEMQEATMKHVKNVNGVVETEMNRFEKVLSAIEGH